MSVKCQEYNHICVIEVQGDLTAEAAEAAKKALDENLEQRHIADFIVDLQKCTFIDSDGLEALLGMKHKLEEKFGQFKLAGADDNCRKILEITRLEHRLECQADLATALKNMR